MVEILLVASGTRKLKYNFYDSGGGDDDEMKH